MRLILCFLTFILSVAAAAAREAAFAGKFYPAEKKELAAFVDSALAAAGEPKLPGRVRAVIAPHAGYPYSGAVAAFAYKAIGEDYDLAVILGAGHTMPVKGAALLAKGYYETPLGRVPVDGKLAAELLKASPLFRDLPAAQAGEHSIEVQLPFLQRRLKKPFKILPVVLNGASPADLEAIGRLLAKKIKGRKAILVASTDLSHYPDHATARLADGTLIKALTALDPGYFLLTARVLSARGAPGLATCACGEDAVAAVMAAVNEGGPARFVELKYADSYDQAPALGGPERVVGYLAGAFVSAEKPAVPALQLSREEKAVLLREARTRIEERLSGKEPDQAPFSEDLSFNLPAAAFVTLTEKGALRGCIGTVEARLGLLDAVRYGAESAAFHDSRFRPVEKGELEKINIEISLLSPLKKVPGAEAVKPRVHGVVVSREGRSGLFLPQVWEQIPDKQAFLGELCGQKAGLERNCWRDKKTDLYIFTVEAFQE